MRHLFDAQKSLETLSNIQGCIPGMKVKYMGATLNGKCAPQCRWENGSMHILPMETSFSYQNMSQLPQVKNPIIGRIFCWKSRSSVLQMFSKSGHNYLIKSAYFLWFQWWYICPDQWTIEGDMTILWSITKLGKSVCRVIWDGSLALSGMLYEGLSQQGNLSKFRGSSFISKRRQVSFRLASFTLATTCLPQISSSS